jgi:hypothetical protein
MHDIAPRGFLGRSYARYHADLGLPEDVTNWSDNHVLIALSRRGEDLPGDLVMGRESFDRFQRLTFENHTARDFPALAGAALAGEHVGSSAGGERPKFTSLVDGQHRMINRHQDNVVLFRNDDGYTLAPAFDQLPMAYASPASGHLRNIAVDEAVPAVNTLEVWDDARAIAMDFWRRASNEDLTDSMAAIVKVHAAR